MKKLFALLFICTLKTSYAQWAIIATAPVGLNDVFFVQADTGYVCGKSGTIAKTVNGGANWTYQNTGTTQELNGLFFLNADTGWACGDKSTILKTINGGATWQQQNYSPGGSILHDLFFVNKNIGYCAGEGGCMKTINGGFNWTSMPTSSPNGRVAVFFTAADTGYVCGVGFADAITKTNDGGATWANMYGPSADEFVSCWFTSDSVGFFVSDITGQIRTTRNAGASWVSYTPAGNPLYDIVFPSTNRGFVVGGTTNAGIIIYTTDGGYTWAPQTSPVANRLRAVYFADTLVGYAISENGSIIKTTNGGVIGTQELSNEKTLSVFPNPSQEFFTVFSEDLKAGGEIVLTDCTGKKIYSEKTEAGKNTATISWGDVAAGIYFLELRAADKSGVVRVVKQP